MNIVQHFLAHSYMWHIVCDMASLSGWHLHQQGPPLNDLMVTFSMRNPSGSTYSAPAPFDDDALQMFLAHLSPAGLKLHEASEVRKTPKSGYCFQLQRLQVPPQIAVVHERIVRKERNGGLPP